jgi:hypothetical protein
MLTWDDDADKLTRDPFLGNVNDFEGYKLFRSSDKYFSDAEVITDGYGTPMFLKPIYQCDLVDDYSGFTDYGLVNGAAYNLGDNTGIKHYFKDENVDNGRTYYYALVAYDYGAPDIGPGISPSENTTVIDIDEYDNIRGTGKNIAIVTPRVNSAGYADPEIILDSLNNNIFGTGNIDLKIVSREQLDPGSEYYMTFNFDTVKNEIDRPLFYSNPGFQVFNKTKNEKIYSESPLYDETGQPNFSGNNLIFNESDSSWVMNESLKSDVFEGLQLSIDQTSVTPTLDSSNTGWMNGASGDINITMTTRESKLVPWDCEIVFTNDTSYTSQVISPFGIYDEFDTRLWFPNRIILGSSFNFYVINKTILDDDGNYTYMDMVAQDFIGPDWSYDGEFNINNDRILVGQLDSLNNWKGTSFVIDFLNIDSTFLPQSGSRYSIKWDRNFWSTDTFKFKVGDLPLINKTNLKADMDKIKVVPNPYVGTNAMEQAVINPFLNQPRRLMFTNIPSNSTISIFTTSGVKIKTITNNNITGGMVHWDLLNEEGLEIAAGMYIYHVKSNFSDNSLNQHEHVGKFAIIK